MRAAALALAAAVALSTPAHADSFSSSYGCSGACGAVLGIINNLPLPIADAQAANAVGSNNPYGGIMGTGPTVMQPWQTGTALVNPGTLWNWPVASTSMFVSFWYNSTWTFPTSINGKGEASIFGNSDTGGERTFDVIVHPASDAPDLNSSGPIVIVTANNPNISGQIVSFAVPNMIKFDGQWHLAQVSLRPGVGNQFTMQASQDRSMYPVFQVSHIAPFPVTTTPVQAFQIPLESGPAGAYHYWAMQPVIPIAGTQHFIQTPQGARVAFAYEPGVMATLGQNGAFTPWLYTFQGAIAGLYVWPQSPIDLAYNILVNNFQEPSLSGPPTAVTLPTDGSGVLFPGQVAPSIYLNGPASPDPLSPSTVVFGYNQGYVNQIGDTGFYTPESDPGYFVEIESIQIDPFSP